MKKIVLVLVWGKGERLWFVLGINFSKFISYGKKE